MTWIETKRGGGGDDSWLGSRHGVANASTKTLDASAFPSATNGIVKSGTQVAESTDVDMVVEFTTPATQTFYGFVIGDINVAGGDMPAPILWHGRVRTANLPNTFVEPTGPSAFIFN